MVRCTSLSPPWPSSKRAPPMASTCERGSRAYCQDSVVVPVPTRTRVHNNPERGGFVKRGSRVLTM
eukprot:1186808-Prorocentrum_minimum.AAC.1